MAFNAPLTPPEEHGICFNELANEDNSPTPTPSSHENTSTEQVSREASPAASETADEVYSSSRNQLDPSIPLVCFPDPIMKHAIPYSYSLYRPCSYDIVHFCNITELAVCYQKDQYNFI